MSKSASGDTVVVFTLEDVGENAKVIFTLSRLAGRPPDRGRELDLLTTGLTVLLCPPLPGCAMDINREAPVIAAADIDASVPPESVWVLLIEVEQWPTWNAEIKAVRIEGSLTEGSRFRWTAGPGWITSTIRQVEPPHVLGWRGTTFTIKAVHVYRLMPIEGATRVRTEESWEGFLARRFAGSFTKQLQQSLHSGLAHLRGCRSADAVSRPTIRRQHAGVK